MTEAAATSKHPTIWPPKNPTLDAACRWLADNTETPIPQFLRALRRGEVPSEAQPDDVRGQLLVSYALRDDEGLAARMKLDVDGQPAAAIEKAVRESLARKGIADADLRDAYKVRRAVAELRRDQWPDWLAGWMKPKHGGGRPPLSERGSVNTGLRLPFHTFVRLEEARGVKIGRDDEGDPVLPEKGAREPYAEAVSRSDFIRALLTGEDLPTPRSQIDRDAARELAAIGSNLNQIARKLNSQKFASEEERKQAVAEVREARRVMRNLVLLVVGEAPEETGG